MRRELVGVRGEEREGHQIIPSVLGKVEVHAPDHVPGGIELLAISVAFWNGAKNPSQESF